MFLRTSKTCVEVLEIRHQLYNIIPGEDFLVPEGIHPNEMKRIIENRKTLEIILEEKEVIEEVITPSVETPEVAPEKDFSAGAEIENLEDLMTVMHLESQKASEQKKSSKSKAKNPLGE